MFVRVLGISTICAAPCLQTAKVLVLGRQAARVVAQVRVVDVQYHPFDVPAVAAVHGHGSLGLLGPECRLRGRRGRMLLLMLMLVVVILLLPSRRRPVAKIHGVARPGDGP